MVTEKEVLELADRLDKHYEQTRAAMMNFDKKWDFKKNMAVEDDFWKEINAMDEKAGKGLAVGRLLQFGFADGYACYIIYKISPRSVKVVHVPLGDAWHDGRIVSQTGSVQKRVAEQNVTWRDNVKRLFGSKKGE